jgi:hypothetical protein
MTGASDKADKYNRIINYSMKGALLDYVNCVGGRGRDDCSSEWNRLRLLRNWIWDDD